MNIRSVFIFISSVLLSYTSYSQGNKQKYLKNNSSVLDASYTFTQKDINVFAFGAYHGSSKTEDAEIFLIKSLLKSNNLNYYFPETDASIAYYFNAYLFSGDEELLKKLIETYGTRVPHERTVEVFNKWKKLKAINDALPEDRKIKVLGADPIVTYQYTYTHLLSMITDRSNWAAARALYNTVEKDTTDFSPYYDSYSKGELKSFVADYETNAAQYQSLITDKAMFGHLIATLKVSFGDYKREEEIFNNYQKLSKMYNLKDKVQFFRYGFGHLLKAKAGRHESFLYLLSQNGVYPKQKIVSVIGYLTDSEVIWKDNYDYNGVYVSSENKGGDGIGDSPDEYFKGIDHLKKTKISDLTIFRLNAKGSPYFQKGSDLIEVIETEARKKTDYSKNATTDFLDYAVLISNSPASKSIYSQP